MGIKKGDEVITPSNSFIASTASIVQYLGAIFIFADIQDDLNIDPSDIEKNNKENKSNYASTFNR